MSRTEAIPAVYLQYKDRFAVKLVDAKEKKWELIFPELNNKTLAIQFDPERAQWLLEDQYYGSFVDIVQLYLS